MIESHQVDIVTTKDIGKVVNTFFTGETARRHALNVIRLFPHLISVLRNGSNRFLVLVEMGQQNGPRIRPYDHDVNVKVFREVISKLLVLGPPERTECLR